jgi:hypothetical protein
MFLVIKFSLYMFRPMMAIIGRRLTLPRKCFTGITLCCLVWVTLVDNIVKNSSVKINTSTVFN